MQSRRAFSATVLPELFTQGGFKNESSDLTIVQETTLFLSHRFRSYPFGNRHPSSRPSRRLQQKK
jgi:hypothetical protein